jgi:hypothetical protein
VSFLVSGFKGVIVAKGRETLGTFLDEGEPISATWPRLLDVVFHDSPNRAIIQRLSPPARTTYLVVCFDGEVINGGFGQFFANASGEHAVETLKALRLVGATLSADLLAKALALFPGSVVPADPERRNELLRELEAEHRGFLDELDQTYYRKVDRLGPDGREDVHGLLVAFMRANAAAPIAAELGAAADRPRD